jgi:hypothetical protein
VKTTVGLVVVVVLAAGCGGGGGDRPGGGTAGAGGSGVMCTPTPCHCADGQWGSQCGGACDCSPATCPAFAPDEDAPFTACGGDPKGTWLADDVVVKGRPLSFGTATCGTSIAPPGPRVAARFVLGADGAAEVAVRGDLYDMHLSADCLSSGGVVCNSLKSGGGFCVQKCGTCVCKNVLADLVGAGRWAAHDSVLDLMIGGADGGLDFCVAGNRLTVHRPGLTLGMRRVQLSGAPTPCAARSNASCGGDGYCHVGDCTGSGTCAQAMGDVDCTSRGCTYHPDACGGAVRATCLLEDYARVPGCLATPL